MNYLDLLDKILLSDNVVENFYINYSNAKFKTWLDSILPELETCKNQQQDNPWHIYNCLDHILHSIEEINKQTKELPNNIRRMLAYVMFYHDMGKPTCHIRRYSKLYKREVDSFFNHNKVSTEIVKRTAKAFNFNDNEIQIIKQLVYKHDIFMFITLTNDGNPHHKVLSPVLLKEEIEDFENLGDGLTLMKYLTMIGKADNLAQNPQMTKNSLHLLETINEMLKNFNYL